MTWSLTFFADRLDLSTEKITYLGTHSDSISSMVFSTSTNSLITGSWDRSIRFWDPRSPNPNAPAGSPPNHEVSKSDTPERIYAMDIVQNTLVAAMASRLFQIYDVRNMRMPMQQRESSLKYMTRSLACMPSGEGYATASVEGRIAVEYFDVRDEVRSYFVLPLVLSLLPYLFLGASPAVVPSI